MQDMTDLADAYYQSLKCPNTDCKDYMEKNSDECYACGFCEGSGIITKRVEDESKVLQKALELAFKSDGCIFPGKKCPKPKKYWPHDCYGCYIDKAKQEVNSDNPKV